MKNRWLAPALTAAMWAFALTVYPRLPQRLPTHWNLRGQVDGWMDKPWGALMMPLMATGVLALMWLLRRVDPRARNVDRFRDEWFLVINFIYLLFAVMEVVTLGYAMGWPVDVDRVVPLVVGLLFLGIGNYLPRIRSNWFMGIRTPWTLDNDRVWRATHRVGGRTFVAAGLIMMLAAFLPASVRTAATLAAAVIGAGVPLVYSYVAYRRDAGRAL